MLKKCSTCKLELPLDLYHKNRSKPDGYKESCKICRKLETKNNYIKNREKIKNEQKLYYESNKKKIQEYKKNWAKKNYNPEKRKQQFLKTKEKIYLRNKTRYDTDILYRLKKCISRRLYMALKKSKSKKTLEYLGCSISDLKIHIENKFTDNITWENYGKWHIDHIIPLSSAKCENDIYRLSHYTNLQPLWAIDNIKKSNRV